MSRIQLPYEGSDIYCDLVLPRLIDIEVVDENEEVLAYHHSRPFWPVHIVVVPKRHVASFTDVPADVLAATISMAQGVAAAVEAEHGRARVLTNLGTYQDSKHLHIHVTSGEPLDRT